MKRNEAYLKQEVVSNDPKDSVEPRGYILCFRGTIEYPMARIVFEDHSIRDVFLSELIPA